MKITIFGLAWSWTSTSWKNLSEALGYTFMSSWNIMRDWAKEAWYETLYEFEDKKAKLDKNFDLKLDQKVKEYWENNDDFIFESRLAWSFIPDSFKIYLHCDESERYRRIHNREWWDLNEIINLNTKRESELITRYKEVYPDIDFPPKEDTFDLFIDWTNLSKEEVLNLILEKIKT